MPGRTTRVISRLSDRTTMYHNALIVALRTTPEPLSAPELVRQMPWVRQTRAHPTYRGARCTALLHHRSDHGRLVRCDGIDHVVEVRPAGHQLYGFLLRLERDGLVARAAGSVEGRRVVWELTERGRAGADIAGVRRIVDPDGVAACGPRPGTGEVVGDEELQGLAAAAEQDLRPGEEVTGLLADSAEPGLVIDLDTLAKAVTAQLDRLGVARSDFAWVAKVGEEGGEVVGALLKRDEGRTTTADVLDELGDVFLAALAACDQLGVAPSTVITQRWASVSKRTPPIVNAAAVGEAR